MKKRIYTFFLITMIVILSTQLIVPITALPYRQRSKSGLPLNIEISMKYNTEVFGEPFGDPKLPNGGFLKTDDGGMLNERKERGEYAYLGYNYNDKPITNDRYFQKVERHGKVFDQNYSNVEWQVVPGAWESWLEVIHDPVLLRYILTTNFYDDDHPTKGETDTGFNLLKLFNIPEGSTDYSEIFNKAELLTTPESGSGYIKLVYTTWNTIRIPAIPRIECIMTAEADKKAIDKGKTEDVTVKIDTRYSYWVMADKVRNDISRRRYWAGTGSRVESEIVTTTDDVCYITLHNISPNTVIYVWSSVTSDEIEALGFNGTDEAVATLFVGENTPDGSGSTGVIEEQFMKPEVQAVLKADQRGNEKFDVSKGIPSSETLYANIFASEYLYRVEVQSVQDSVYDTITVYHYDEEGNVVTSTESFKRDYNYLDITSLEVYAIKSVTLENGALPGGKVTLTPTSAYKRPQVEFVDVEEHVEKESPSYTTFEGSTAEGVNAAAYSSLPSLTVRNDILKINGKTIVSEHASLPEKIEPEITNSNALFQSGLKIPPEVLNGTYETKGTITYERIYAVNPKGEREITLLIEGNTVSVHTPVYMDFSVSDDDSHNQKPYPNEKMSGIILGRPFTVTLSSYGPHRNIRGYGTRDYTSYVKDRQIKFDFDVYLGTGRDGTFLKGDTWYSLSELGIDNKQEKVTFYTPVWVDEGIYEIEVRSLALNDTSGGSSAEENANLNPSNYAASKVQSVEVSGRVYDFKVTDTDDPGWETFFRKAKGEKEPSGKVFFTGPLNINGDREAQRKYVLPVMPGKNDMPGYQNRAVKLGYAVRFEIRTIGNYYDRNDYLQIKPRFYFVDRNGKNRQEVDLYYLTADSQFIKIGSEKDTRTNSMKIDFVRRGIDAKEFTDTAAAMFRLRGGMQGYSLEEWTKIFPQISQKGVDVYKFTEILLNEPVRSYVGPQRNIPESVSKDKALASVQKWYGEYCLPANCLAVPKGTDLSKERSLTSSSPVFLKDGYIIVNFRDISVINDGDFERPSLKYTGKTGDGWKLEGYATNQNGWELEYGDVIVYYADKRATDDYYSAGTH